MIKTLIIVGNAPSLCEVNWDLLHSVDTIGMNGAYRFYPEMGWYPKYFCCFDRRVAKHHARGYISMIMDESIPIDHYYFEYQIINHPKVTRLGFHGSFGTFSDKFETFGNGGSTGANAAQVGVCLGYKKLILVGIDADYVNYVEGSKRRGQELVMIKTPDRNPNYFWNDYQREGDVYNVPAANNYHLPGWKRFAAFADTVGVEVVVCSSTSKIDCFRRSTLEKELKCPK